MLEEIQKDPGLISGMNTSCDALTTYLEIQARGLSVDSDKLALAKLLTSSDVRRQEDIINILLGRDINIGSSQQLVSLFHEEHGYKVIARSTKTQQPKLGKKELQSLAVKTRNPIIPLIINGKKLRKSNSMLSFVSL